MRQRHRIAPGAEDDFAVRNIAEIVGTRTQTTRLMSLLLGAVASISLIVGGIGIMNIMLVSVTERIREIGLRMAVGAGPREIQAQFLAEAMLISLGGGCIGIALGIGGALLTEQVRRAAGRSWNAQVIMMATGFSVGHRPVLRLSTRRARPRSSIRSRRCATSDRVSVGAAQAAT